jgi:hypothetical protein
LLSLPDRYMHSPNGMVVLEGLERTARLLAALVRREGTGWIISRRDGPPMADDGEGRPADRPCPFPIIIRVWP